MAASPLPGHVRGAFRSGSIRKERVYDPDTRDRDIERADKVQSDEQQGRNSGALVLPYLRLVRAPAVFSAIGDPVVGQLIASGRLAGGSSGLLMLAAGSVYLGGMALNDVADRAEDARERPERPIPSGAVPVATAAAIGASLLLGGHLAARRAGAGSTSLALAGAVVAYDFALKRSAAFGPLGMGACRGLSLLMGAEAGAGAAGVRRAAGSAVLLGSYVAGVTVLARGETGEDVRAPVRIGALLAATSLAAAAAVGRRGSLPWLAVAAATAAPAVIRAVRRPAPATVGPAVGAMIRAIPAIGGSLAARRSPGAAAMLLPLVALARWGRKLIPVH